MRSRGLRVVLAAVLVTGTAAWSGDATPATGAGQAQELAAATPVAATAVSAAQRRKRRFECHGVTHRDVLGPEPTYTRKKLVKHRNHKRVCRASWIPNPRQKLVPQGLAVHTQTAWMSGYLYRPSTGKRPCRLMRIGMRSGRLIDYRAVEGRVGKRGATFCRHGGGILQRGRWLWITEKNKLWLVDWRSTRGKVIQARRVWRLERPVRGSTIIGKGRRLGLVPFAKRGPAHIHWFSTRQLFRKGVLELGGRRDGRKQAGALARTRIPSHVQGATIGPNGRLYLSRSNLTCGELVTPWRRIAIVPGAEGIDFDGRRLWVASESGAKPYAAGTRKPLTAGITSFEWPGLNRARRSTCSF